MTINPEGLGDGIGRLALGSPFHAWTPDELKQFEAHHKVGTKARLALALMLYLGVRRGDVVTLASMSAMA
jgi:hypothetical protein